MTQSKLKILKFQFYQIFVTSQSTYYHFGEYGEYEMNFIINSSSNCKIKVVKVKEPVNSMLPILVAFCTLFGLAVVYLVAEKLWVLKKEKIETDVPLIQEESTADDSSTTDQKQQMTSFSKTLDEDSKPRERLKSIDSFRGLCIIVMIFVNFRGGNYWFFRHSAWNGLTVADLVFPWFMFLMGVNITLSVESLIKKKTSSREIAYKVVRRTLILFAIGAFIINHNTSWSTFRIPGVLQRFAIAYFISFLLQWAFHITATDMKSYSFEKFPSLNIFKDIIFYWIQWIFVILLEILWLCLTFLLPVPGCPTGYIGAGGLADGGAYNKSCVGGSAGYIDRWLFGENHMYGHPTCKNIYYPMLTNDEKVPYDPEGVLGSINGCIMVLLGCQAGKIFLYYSSQKRISRWVAWSLFLGIVSIILCRASMNGGWIPVNKNLWSTSYVTTLASMANIIIAIFYYVIDVAKVWSGRPLSYVGMNSILLYVGHEVFANYVPFSWGITEHATHTEWLIMNLLGVTCWVVIAYYCFSIQFFLKI